MILKKIQKKISLFTLFFLFSFIYILISSKVFASNKDIKNPWTLDHNIFLYEKELIDKNNTEEWIKTLNSHINFYERKILINQDYLNLIKIFPSKKNIKSIDINKELTKNKKILSAHIEKLDTLKNLYNFLNSKEYFDIYLVIYDLRIINKSESDDKYFKWFSFCALNSKYDEELIIFRKNLLDVFYFFANKGYPIYQNSIRDQKDLRISESKLHQIVCNEFMKKKDS